MVEHPPTLIALLISVYVKDNSSGSWMEYVYFGGQPIAEKNSDGTWSDYIFANGLRIAMSGSANPTIPQNGTTYYHGDQLGSTRLLTNGSGSVVSTDNFYPFGQEQSTSGTANHYKIYRQRTGYGIWARLFWGSILQFNYGTLYVS